MYPSPKAFPGRVFWESLRKAGATRYGMSKLSLVRLQSVMNFVALVDFCDHDYTV